VAYKIVVDIVDPGDGKIKVSHTFWGQDEREARTNYAHHLGACEYFRAAEENGDVIEEEFEISEAEIPEAEEVDEDEVCQECGKTIDECTCE
jgi:hypothetical protein